MANPISAKCPECPECSATFPLNEAVLGSLREHLSDELSAKAKQREEEAEERLNKARQAEA